MLDETEAVGSNHGAVENRDAVADHNIFANRAMAMAGEVVPDPDSGIERDVRMDHGVAPNLGVITDYRVRSDMSVSAKTGGFRNHGCRMNSGLRTRWRKKDRKDAREVESWVRADQGRAGGFAGEFDGNDGCRRRCDAQRGGIPGANREGDHSRSGGFERRRRDDLNRAVAAKFETEIFRQFSQLHLSLRSSGHVSQLA
jgi:hypothetical protein